MNKYRLSFVAALLLAVAALPAFGQYYPLPASTTEGPATYNGLPTYQYSLPLKDHTGRVVDSASMIDDTRGMRTARAGLVRVAPARGSVPARIYMQLGATIAAYSTDKFFNQLLPGGLMPVSSIMPATRTGPAEKVLVPQAYVYPEGKGSGWVLQNSDGNDRLYDFDVDDRGYIYAAYTIFGWGIIRDNGAVATNPGHLPLMSQWIYRSCKETKGATPCDETSDNPFGPVMIVTVKSGSSYYTITNDGGSASLPVYDVTNPSVKSMPTYITGKEYAYAAWAKSPDMTRLAIIDGKLDVRIYEAGQYVTNGPAIFSLTKAQAEGRSFLAIAGDGDGAFWALQAAKDGNSLASLWKFAPSGGTYVASKYDIAGSPGYTPQTLDVGDGFVGIGGYNNGPGEVHLFKVEGGRPVQLDASFFGKYYHKAPAGYSTPEHIIPKAVRPIKFNGKTYVLYSAFGLADVYELQAGDSVTAQKLGSSEFYGDEFRFTSSTTSEFPVAVTWNFGNPEASDNEVPPPIRTGTEVTHRYSGLTTAAAITSPKTVTLRLVSSPDVSDGVTITMKAPQARVKVVSLQASSPSPATPIENNAELLFGDQFVDISDGQAAGHYNVWTIDNVTSVGTNVGLLGNRTLTYAAKYGLPSAASVYQSTVGPFNYKVLPFVAKLKDPVRTGSAVTFGATARYTTEKTIIPDGIAQWETTWTLKNGATDVVPPQVLPASLGTIPNFVVAPTIPAGSVLKLTITLLPTALVPVPLITAPFATYSLVSTLETPTDVTITATGCANVGSACTLTATPVGTSTPNWDKIEWAVKLGGTSKFTGTGSTVNITSSLTAAGTYSAEVTVSRSIFSKTGTPKSLVIEPTLCDGALPNNNNMSLGVLGLESNCNGTGCKTGEQFRLSAQAFNYNVQPCDRFNWTFGDGTTQATTVPETTKTYAGSGPYTAKLTITNTSNNTTSISFSKTISFGTIVNPDPDPVPTCTAPSSITVSYSGATSNCAAGNGVSCKVGETITFSARRSGGNLQSCDGVSWTFGDGTTSTVKTATKAYGSANTFNVVAIVSNNVGSSESAPRAVPVVADTGIPGCSATPSDRNLFITYTGLSSGCTPTSTAVCRPNETLRFDVEGFGYQIQGCDTFLWNFNDGTSTATTRVVEHAFTGTTASRSVSLRVQNVNGTANLTRVVTLEGAPAPATPVLTMTTKPATAGKNGVVTFTASSDIANTTGWTWEFGDGSAIDNSQNDVTGGSNSISHTFTKAGTFTVKASARNAAAGPTGAKGQATHTIVITDVPEHRFLLPVVTHLGGLGGSSWRTDVQIYNPDPAVSQANPMTMKVTFKGTTQTITVPQATMVFDDFMNRFTSGDESGSMIVSVTGNYQPQIWTRTYNQTATGTFGQFIPGILISGDGSGGAGTEAPKYYLAGLRQNATYRTNLGFVNPNSTAITISGTVYEAEKGLSIGTFTKTLQPFTLEPVNGLHTLINRTLMPDRPFSVEIEVPAGKWLIAYASTLDNKTGDPTYLQAVRAGELASADYKEEVLPGVGRIGSWRSDVTILNPDTKGVSLQLSYYDQTGTLKKTTPGVVLGPLEMLQLDDLLRTSHMNVDGDALGALRIKVETTNNAHFPLVFGRTYFDSPTGTYGQGIGAVSAKRANVKAGKPGIIPAVRSTAEYYTNVGLTNVSDKAATVRVTLLDADSGAQGLTETYELAPYQSIVRSPVAGVDIIKALSPNAVRASFRVEIVGGTGEVWAYASCIDKRTFDPEYIAAIPMP